MPDRTVLFITSRFPPVASVGALRVRKFCRYLPQHGWNPVVITGPIESIDDSNSESTAAARDFAALDDLPATLPIARLPAALQRWPRAATERWSHRLARVTNWIGLDSKRWNAGLAWRVEATWRALSFPDIGIWQRRAAVEAAIDLHRQHRFAAIFSSAMPFSDHLIALAVQRRLPIPWIADFRDPWIGYVHAEAPASRLHRLLAPRAEARIIDAAARVVSIGDTMTARFRARFPHLKPEKFATIRNGFDPADSCLAASQSPGNPIRLLYTGSFYAGRGPQTLLDALRQFNQQASGREPRIHLELAGRAGPFSNIIRDAAAEGLATWHGLVPHQRAVQLMNECDVLVVIQDDRPGTEIDVSAKTYEYLGSGKPILALVGADGEAHRLLSHFDGVWSCPPFNEAAILRTLGDLVARHQSRGLRVSRPADDLAPLTRPHQARQLAQLLDDITETPPRRPRLSRITRRIRDARNIEQLTILAYHRISDEPSPLTDGRSLTHSVADFERQMAYVAAQYEPTRLSDAITALEAGRPLRRAVVITIDDGYADSLRIAAPILRRLSIPAVSCVPTAVLDNADLLWRDKLNWLLLSGHAVAACEAIRSACRKRGCVANPGESTLDLTRRSYLHDVIPPLLDELLHRAGTTARDLAHNLNAYITRRDLRAIDPDWIELANHTHTHPVLSALDPTEQRHEFEIARQILIDATGRAPDSVAIPFGIKSTYTEKTIDAVRDTHHRAALDLRRRPNRREVSPFNLSRIPAPIGDAAALQRAIDRRPTQPSRTRSLAHA